MRLSAFGVSVCLALGALTVVAPPAAAADSVFLLPEGATVNDVVVDEAHGHVFLSAWQGGVLVRDLDGNAVTTIPGQDWARDVALSPDGSRLYVALYYAHAVTAIDTTTLTEVARYDLGEGNYGTAVTAGTDDAVWFAYNFANDGSGNYGDIGVVDLSGETPVVTMARAPAEAAPTAGPPRLDIPATNPGLLIAARQVGSATMLHTYAIAGDSLATVASQQAAGEVVGFTTTADGLSILSTEYEIGVKRYRLSDLAPEGAYGSGYGAPPVAVAVAPTGNVAVGIAVGDEGVPAPDAYVFGGDGALRRTHDVCCEDGPHSVNRQGLAWSADASDLYMVLSNWGANYLHVLRDPTDATSAIALTKPASAKVRSTFTITGKLTALVPVPAGTALQVTRSSKYGTVARPAVTTAADGTFSVVDNVAKRGTYTYTVSWTGDGEHVGTSRSVTFTVVGLTPYLAISTNASTYQYNATARVLVRLGTTAGNRTVLVRRQRLGGSLRVVASGTVNADGYFRASATVPWRTTFEASFAGDDVYEPRKVTRAVRVYAKVTQSLSGHYAVSNGYYLFRRTVDPKVISKVAPYSWACLWSVAERYTAGAWRHVDDSECLYAEPDGIGESTLVGTPTVGVPYRIRSRWAGNSYNLAASSPWQYLKFT